MLRLVTPHLQVASVLDVQAAHLYERGLEGLLLDVDCTLKDHHATDFPAVMAKINSGPGFRFYSVEVVSSAFLPGFTNSVMAQMTRIHNTWGQSLTSIPALDPTLPLLFADDPQFH